MYFCPKCNSPLVSTERRPDGDSKCLDCFFVDKTSNFKTKENTMIQEITSYKTIDGLVFVSKAEAESHQNKLTAVQDRQTFKDLVNQLIILMERTQIWSEETTRLAKTNYDNVQGSHLLRELKTVVAHEFDENKYYNSACF